MQSIYRAMVKTRVIRHIVRGAREMIVSNVVGALLKIFTSSTSIFTTHHAYSYDNFIDCMGLTDSP